MRDREAGIKERGRANFKTHIVSFNLAADEGFNNLPY